MIDVADLPEPVRKAVAEGATADVMRREAAVRINAIGCLFAAREWSMIVQLLALAIGFLTAADRLEENEAA
jgi:stage V sporulation protein SpoVS